eukprot:11719608-Heterocapsa_arctica.AAC.1
MLHKDWSDGFEIPDISIWTTVDRPSEGELTLSHSAGWGSNISYPALLSQIRQRRDPIREIEAFMCSGRPLLPRSV